MGRSSSGQGAGVLWERRDSYMERIGNEELRGNGGADCRNLLGGCSV